MLRVVLIFLLTTGCSTLYPQKGDSTFVQLTYEVASHTGCPPESINITEVKPIPGQFYVLYFFNARCKGRNYYCSLKFMGGDSDTDCHESL